MVILTDNSYVFQINRKTHIYVILILMRKKRISKRLGQAQQSLWVGCQALPSDPLLPPMAAILTLSLKQ